MMPAKIRSASSCLAISGCCWKKYACTMTIAAATNAARRERKRVPSEKTATGKKREEGRISELEDPDVLAPDERVQ